MNTTHSQLDLPFPRLVQSLVAQLVKENSGHLTASDIKVLVGETLATQSAQLVERELQRGTEKGTFHLGPQFRIEFRE